MTYNVFGGTLNPAQSNLLELVLSTKVQFLCLYPQNAPFCTKLPPHYKALYVYRQNC